MCISGLVCLLNWKLCWVSCRVSMTHHSWSWLESRTRLSWLLRSLESGLLRDRQKRTSSRYQMRFISSQSRWESYSSSGPGTTPGALLSCHLLAPLLQVGRHSLHTCDSHVPLITAVWVWEGTATTRCHSHCAVFSCVQLDSVMLDFIKPKMYFVFITDLTRQSPTLGMFYST